MFTAFVFAIETFHSQGSVLCAVVLGDVEQNPLGPLAAASALRTNGQQTPPSPKTEGFGSSRVRF